ncbi:MAG TPA: hypothetical protein VFA11_17610 [Acidimicrobiales bacterium]|nr:hypothetical protein [Acidimicrobiales bacterium]
MSEGAENPAWIHRSAAISTTVPSRGVVQVDIDAGPTQHVQVRWVGPVEVRVEAAGQPVAAKFTVRDGEVPPTVEAAFGPMVSQAIRTMASPAGFGPWRRARPRYRAGVPLGAPEPPFLPRAVIRVDYDSEVIELGPVRSGPWWAVRWQREGESLSHPSATPLGDAEAVKAWLSEQGLSDYIGSVT